MYFQRRVDYDNLYPEEFGSIAQSSLKYAYTILLLQYEVMPKDLLPTKTTRTWVNYDIFKAWLSS